MSWNNNAEQPSGAFNWALFATAAVAGFFAGWIKRLVFAVLAPSKKAKK